MQHVYVRRRRKARVLKEAENVPHNDKKQQNEIQGTHTRYINLVLIDTYVFGNEIREYQYI